MGPSSMGTKVVRAVDMYEAILWSKSPKSAPRLGLCKPKEESSLSGMDLPSFQRLMVGDRHLWKHRHETDDEAAVGIMRRLEHSQKEMILRERGKLLAWNTVRKR